MGLGLNLKMPRQNLVWFLRDGKWSRILVAVSTLGWLLEMTVFDRKSLVL